MTAVLVCVSVSLVLGALCGWLVFRRLAAREYRRGLFAGELQAKLLYGWHPAANADAAAVKSVQPRRRSPNEQFVSRPPSQARSRPVMHD